MGERITKIDLQAFRAVPGTFAMELPDGRSCVVLGDNGTGKSSIADAVEWYFEGQIEFLKKEGRGNAIRHSGANADLDTTVAIGTDGSLGGSITTDTLPQPEVLRVGKSELFMLRGRTLAAFVDKTKGQKWQALAELLGLDAINQLRLDLQYARNALEDEAQNRAEELATRESSLGELVADVSDTGVLQALAAKCTAAAVQVPESLSEALTAEWIAAIVPEASNDKGVVTLKNALADLQALAKQPLVLDPIDSWNQFVAEEKRDLLPLNLYRAAEPLLGSDSQEPNQCPLCGQPVEAAALKDKVATTLHELESAARKLEAARRNIQGFIGKVRSADGQRSEIVQLVREQGLDLPAGPCSPHGQFGKNVEALTSISHVTAEQHQLKASDWMAEVIEAVEAAMPPTATTREQTLVEIGILHAQAQQWKLTERKHTQAVAAFKLADQVFARYQEHQRDYLTRTIQQISQRSADIYHFLHPDEGIEEVTVGAVGEKGIELSVKYFGKTERPPHRVLSESHMNSLGLALFLAMAETFNDDLSFLVLDDVVNSFDRSHRGRLAELLVSQFGNKQLIILTHDEQFYDRIYRLAPSWIGEQFTSWSYSDGPRTRRQTGERFLAEAAEELSVGNRVGAAQKGRRALEEFLQEACEKLEALLPFRRGQRNDQRMADEVMKGLRRTLRDRAKPLYKHVSPLLQLLEADLQAALNVESHASQGSTSSVEIKDALTRVGDLQQHFTCDSCKTRVWHRGTAEASQCKCGQTTFPPPALSE